VTLGQPWWVFGLTGSFALFGVVLAQLSTFVLERHRAAREDRYRWHDERRKLYAHFVACYNMAARRLYNEWLNDAALDLDRFDEYNDFMAVKMELSLLASKSVREAADRLSDMLERLCASRQEADRQVKLAELFSESHAVRDDFVGVARKALRIRD
jgi:hypothetical protein